MCLNHSGLQNQEEDSDIPGSQFLQKQMEFYSLHWWLISSSCAFSCVLLHKPKPSSSCLSHLEVVSSCSEFLLDSSKARCNSPSVFSLNPHKSHFASLGQFSCSENEMKGRKGIQWALEQSLPVQSEKDTPIDFLFLCPLTTISDFGI